MVTWLLGACWPHRKKQVQTYPLVNSPVGSLIVGNVCLMKREGRSSFWLIGKRNWNWSTLIEICWKSVGTNVRKQVVLQTQIAAIGTKSVKNTHQNSKEPDFNSRKEKGLYYPDVLVITDPSGGIKL